MHVMNESIGKQREKDVDSFRFSNEFGKLALFSYKTSTLSFREVRISTYSRRRDCTKMNRNKEMHS